MLNVSALRVGDDAGNGGFAYKQSIKILKMASDEVLELVRTSDYHELVNYPERRQILETALIYDNLIKLPNESGYRGNRLLAMDYIVTPPSVKIYKAFYMSFAGTLDRDLRAASLEVQKRLLHEASHIWGFNETQSEKFSIDFLQYEGNRDDDIPDRDNLIINQDQCICENGKSVGGSNCLNFCESRNDKVPTLYGSVAISGRDLSNPDLGNLEAWCHNEVSYSRHTTPNCYMNTWDGNSNNKLPIQFIGEDRFAVSLSSLERRKSYVFKIESTTGAVSDAFQERISQNNRDVSAIRMYEINKYYCLLFSGIIDGSDREFREVIESNFYYSSRTSPRPVPANQSDFTVCHDRNTYGDRDSIMFPRLGNREGVFTVWSAFDPLLLDQDQDGKEDINKLIESELEDRYGQRVSLNLFSDFRSNIDVSGGNRSLGKMLKPFIDTRTGFNFCPTSEHYNGNNPLFNILSDYLSVDTEPLFLAERQNIIFDDGTAASKDFLYLSLSEIKEVWFYYNNGQHIKPSFEDRFNKTLYFYWPMDKNNPYVRKSYQKIYTVVRDDDQFVSTADKSVACIPKLNSSSNDFGKPVGESCSSDLQCNTSCCSETSNSCSEHIPSHGVLCSKEVGQSCITNEFCKKEPVTVCKLRRTGLDLNGKVTCAIRCETQEVHNTCSNFTCMPSENPPIPDFDPENPDCSNAI
ncbi:hypothetical protein [Halobacteriovorax sp.]|uniref:hypothetical protein n=1 Tax=Halobacteriovorax sp. TaxID=2020862 RepID=UPI0035626E27